MTFAQTFENVLSVRLSELYNREVTVEYLHEVRDAVACAFMECLRDSVYATSISVAGAQWIVNEVFKEIRLTPDAKINDIIVTNDIDVEQIDVNSLTSLREMFEGTQTFAKLNTEYVRRITGE